MVVSISERESQASVVFAEDEAEIFIEELTRVLEQLREIKAAVMKRKRSLKGVAQ